MKTVKQFFFVFAFVTLVYSCKNENNEASVNKTVAETENKSNKKTGQAFIKERTPPQLYQSIWQECSFFGN